MRILALAILAIGTVSIGRAQMCDPAYPVCLYVYKGANYYECRYTSLPQCNASASGAGLGASSIRILRARKRPQIIGGIAAPTNSAPTACAEAALHRQAPSLGREGDV
jgi:Protein of unknown function (DUF3551)